MEKEFLYVGHYVDTNGDYILKIGTTNNLDRRQKEHTRNYKRSQILQCQKMENLNTIGRVRYPNTILYDLRTETEKNGKKRKSATL